jgi:hypothetical protein
MTKEQTSIRKKAARTKGWKKKEAKDTRFNTQHENRALEQQENTS